MMQEEHQRLQQQMFQQHFRQQFQHASMNTSQQFSSMAFSENNYSTYNSMNFPNSLFDYSSNSSMFGMQEEDGNIRNSNIQNTHVHFQPQLQGIYRNPNQLYMTQINQPSKQMNFGMPNQGFHYQHQIQSKKSKWSTHEDELLRRAVEIHGEHDWKAIAALVPNRNSKQCRERWTAQLNPDLTREEWTAEEDATLIHMQSIHGNLWAKISTFLPGRSSNAVKNRFNWLTRRNLPQKIFEYKSQQCTNSSTSGSNNSNSVECSGSFIETDNEVDTEPDIENTFSSETKHQTNPNFHVTFNETTQEPINDTQNDNQWPNPQQNSIFSTRRNCYSLPADDPPFFSLNTFPVKSKSLDNQEEDESYFWESTVDFAITTEGRENENGIDEWPY